MVREKKKKKKKKDTATRVLWNTMDLQKSFSRGACTALAVG